MSRPPKALKPATPLPDAARHCLAHSLSQVRAHLKRAHAAGNLAPETVHQLRVSTRRARAQLDVFACCLPPRVHRQACRMLRDVRRAAGEARDWDVFIDGLEGHGPALEGLLGYALARREAAHTQLLGAVQAVAPPWDALEAEVLNAIRPARPARLRTLADLARHTLGGLVAALDAAAQADLTQPQALHQVRIEGKRLRYALEVFATALGPALPERILPAVAHMQTLLGQAQDSAVAHARLAAQMRGLAPQHWPRHRPGLTQLQRHHQRQQPRARREFAAWWAHWLRFERAELLGLLQG